MQIALYRKLLRVSVKSQMQYSASFLMITLASFISTFFEIFGIWVLFDRFKMIQNWTLPELGLIYGIVNMGFAIAEIFTRGFDKFSNIVKNGDFDRILLRPISSLMQVATQELELIKLGRCLQGLLILLWAASKLNLFFLSFSSVIIIFSILGTTCLFSGLFIIQGTLVFWTTETLELMNITTYGGLEAGQYPMSIYNHYFKLFFTFIIPLACVAYYPIATLLNHESYQTLFAVIAPFSGMLFLYLSCQFWKLGVQHYRPTGS